MEKRKDMYAAPELEIVNLECSDIMLTSNPTEEWPDDQGPLDPA